MLLRSRIDQATSTPALSLPALLPLRYFIHRLSVRARNPPLAFPLPLLLLLVLLFFLCFFLLFLASVSQDEIRAASARQNDCLCVRLTDYPYAAGDTRGKAMGDQGETVVYGADSRWSGRDVSARPKKKICRKRRWRCCQCLRRDRCACLAGLTRRLGRRLRLVASADLSAVPSTEI